MESTSMSKSRGGAREGAGRKAVDPAVKKVSVTFALSPEQKVRIQAAAKAAGLSASELVGRWAESL